MSEAAGDYNRVSGRWTATVVRSRRVWRRWVRTHEELTGIDPFAPWDLLQNKEREAFAVLSGLARFDDDAMSAWCAKSAPLWRRHFSTAPGRYHEPNEQVPGRSRVSAEGASLAALAMALGKLDPARLSQKRYPFLAVMDQARQVERCRRVLPRNPCVDPVQIAGSATDGMDPFADLSDTVSLLRRMVQTHDPRHRESMRRTIEDQVSAFLGETEWSSTASLQNRQKLKRRRNKLAAEACPSSIETSSRVPVRAAA